VSKESFAFKLLLEDPSFAMTFAELRIDYGGLRRRLFVYNVLQGDFSYERCLKNMFEVIDRVNNGLSWYDVLSSRVNERSKHMPEVSLHESH